jgi:hypothetical protein
MKRDWVGFVAVGFFVLLVAPNTGASPIRYTFTGNATGSVGAVTFTSAPFTVDVSGDTNTITSTPLAQWANPVTGSISISGVGVAAIAEPVVMRTSCGAGTPRAGLERSPGGIPFPNMLFYASPVAGLSACKLLITPLQSGLGATIGPFTALASSLGPITVTTMSQLTYQAQDIVALSVPGLGPLGMVLLTIGLALAGMWATRMRGDARR